MTDIFGEIGAMHTDSGSLSEKQDRLNAMVQQLGSMLETAASGMQGQGRIALDRAGEDLQQFGTLQAAMQGEHSDKMNAAASALTTGDEDSANFISSINSMST